MQADRIFINVFFPFGLLSKQRAATHNLSKHFHMHDMQVVYFEYLHVHLWYIFYFSAPLRTVGRDDSRFSGGKAIVHKSLLRRSAQSYVVSDFPECFRNSMFTVTSHYRKKGRSTGQRKITFSVLIIFFYMTANQGPVSINKPIF